MKGTEVNRTLSRAETQRAVDITIAALREVGHPATPTIAPARGGGYTGVLKMEAADPVVYRASVLAIEAVDPGRMIPCENCWIAANGKTGDDVCIPSSLALNGVTCS